MQSEQVAANTGGELQLVAEGTQTCDEPCDEQEGDTELPEEASASPFFPPDGLKLTIGKNTSVKVGAGLRTSFNTLEDASPNNRRWSSDFNLDNMRLYVSGNVIEHVGFEFNTDINNAQGFPDADEVRVLDAVAKFELHDWFNVWAGRFLPPSDRSNLDGPFYLLAWEFPYVQFGYPNIFQGRDDGVALWGQVGEGAFKWQVGWFKGTDGFPNGDDHRMVAARLVLNLLDPEPGYYNQSTYFGEKDILAVGLAAMHQQDAVGTIADPEEFTGWSLDGLFEKKLPNDGVVTVECAFYDFDDNDSPFQEVAPGTFVPQLRQGESFFILAAYLFPNEIGFGNICGRFQPYVRYLDYDRDFPAAGAFEEGIDLGLNYIISGHDARLALVYSRRDPGPGLERFDLVRLGAQLQY